MNTPKRKPTLVFLQELLKGINANKGTVNCGHCALRFDEHMASGENLALGAVPKENAGLDFEPIIKRGKIERSATQDQRIIDRTTAPPQDYRVIIDIDHQSGTTLEIDLTTGGQPHDRVNFFLESEKSIIQALQALPRRKKDGTAYGFILLTHSKENDLGHIFNYFVDSNIRGNQVYFIDAQKPRAQITTKLDLSGYRSEIFYRPSRPPEGIQIKTEPKAIIKQERDISMNNAVDDDKLEDFLCHAAYTNNTVLGNSYAKLMAEKKLKPNYNRLAAYAAKGGHPKLVERFLGKITDESKRDYNRVAVYATKGGHHELAEQIRNKSIMHSNVSQNQNSENTLPRAETLIFSQSNQSNRSKSPSAPSLPVRQELSILRAKYKLLQSELVIKNQLIALQNQEIAALRNRFENEPEASSIRKVMPSQL